MLKVYQPVTAIAYNVENLFDADGVAVYSDYLPTDKQGNSQYSPADVFTKLVILLRC